MPKTRDKTPGWAAVDLQLRQGVVVGSEHQTVPFQPFQSIIVPRHPCRNRTRSHDLSTRPLSSVLMPPVGVSSTSKEMKHELPTDCLISGKKYKNVIVNKDVQKLSLEKLMERYSLADPSLIEDIMSAVGDDIESASKILEEMYPSHSFNSKNRTSSTDISYSIKDIGHGKFILEPEVESGSKTMLGHSDMSSSLNDILAGSCKGLNSGFEPSGEQFSDAAVASIQDSFMHLKFIPLEPEWEKDDVYLSHRKDAIKLMRSAAQHSRMASNSFLKRDHYSAQHHSSRARQDRLAAENLHSKAAKEILSINNSKNDIWKLDLHGLHAGEAVKALQNHLMMIETQSSPHRSISPKRVTGTSIMSVSLSLNCMAKDSGSGASSRPRPTTLEVITGRGLHSKGHAALPAAVRGFLDGNGYRYDETRPGVITVRPKFQRGKYLPK